MLTRIFSATPYGIESKIIAVEVAYNPGLPGMYIVGLPDTAIRESRERIRGCLRNIKSFEYPIGRIIVNLAPASLHKYGTQFDLAIAIAIANIKHAFSREIQRFAFIGELSLNGAVRPVKACLAMMLAAKKEKFTAIVIPWENAEEASYIKDIKVYAVKTVEECVRFCEGSGTLPLASTVKLSGAAPHKLLKVEKDFKNIEGLKFAKRGLEIAASGNHNILISGSPGLGKTLLAEAFPTILPNLNDEQFLEVLTISGVRNHKIAQTRRPPFRAPLPGITEAAFLGGGAMVQPGEISLAHNGVLFMDEFPEFPRAIIESLRQPLERGIIPIDRIQGRFIFPAEFILIAAQNLCPCGYYGDLRKECTCSAMRIIKYKQKISGPIIDRIDIHIRLQRTDYSTETKSESSADILKRVCSARKIQLARNPNRTLNGKLPHTEIQNISKLSPAVESLLRSAENAFGMSIRSRIKVLKLSRTIADMENSTNILEDHLAEALRYRFPE